MSDSESNQSRPIRDLRDHVVGLDPKLLGFCSKGCSALLASYMWMFILCPSSSIKMLRVRITASHLIIIITIIMNINVLSQFAKDDSKGWVKDAGKCSVGLKSWMVELICGTCKQKNKRNMQLFSNLSLHQQIKLQLTCGSVQGSGNGYKLGQHLLQWTWLTLRESTRTKRRKCSRQHFANQKCSKTI